MQNELSLFVYGSFSQGMIHFSFINSYVKRVVSGSVLGHVYRLDVGYPILVLPEDSENLLGECDRVPGQLLTLEAPDLVYKILDEFHGFTAAITPEKCLFLKRQTQVLTDGESCEAVVYGFNPAKLGKSARRISGGDWHADLANNPPITDSLTERQSVYVKRLSQTSGREIVPIDLDLYRELLKLELIIDKGRRLALTKLGQEVARYLP